MGCKDAQGGKEVGVRWGVVLVVGRGVWACCGGSCVQAELPDTTDRLQLLMTTTTGSRRSILVAPLAWRSCGTQNSFT